MPALRGKADISYNLQIEAYIRLRYVDDMKLQDCIPKTKHDCDAIEQATSVSFPLINPIIPNLLEWLQDANWPVAHPTAHLLTQAGPEIVPHIRQVLSSSDSIWKFWTLKLLVINLQPNLLEELRPDIMKLTSTSIQDDVCIIAKEILSCS